MGDQLLAIDGVTLEYTTLAEVYQLLKGSSNSQNIRVEIVPRYLRGVYVQQDQQRHKHKSRNRDTPTPTHRPATKNGPPEYAVIMASGQRKKQLSAQLSVDSALPPKGSSTSANGGQSMLSRSATHRPRQNGVSSPSSSNYHGRNHNGNSEHNKKSPEKETRQSQQQQFSNGGGGGRGRKLTKHQQQQLFSVSQLVSSGSEKCKKGDRRHSSASSKSAHNGRGRSASAAGVRYGTPVHDLMPLSSGKYRLPTVFWNEACSWLG